MTTLAELDEFVRNCDAHDWTYEFSDDGAMYRRGQSQRMALNSKAKTDAVLMAAFNAYLNYHFPKVASSAAWPEKKLVFDVILEALRSDLKRQATEALITPKETA